MREHACTHTGGERALTQADADTSRDHYLTYPSGHVTAEAHAAQRLKTLKSISRQK